MGLDKLIGVDKIPFFPPEASTFAREIDVLYLVTWLLTILFLGIVVAMLGVLAFIYRRKSKADRSHPIHTHHGIELAWSIIPMLLGLVIFVWGAKLYADAYKVPDNAEEIFVVGKQWMWHIQHTNGIRENNTLTVPTGRPFKLTCISQDVIHSFFIPAFRIKRDVLPGSYTSAWFEATLPGKYHLFCAEYCGTEHSRMTGTVNVLTPEDYQRWLDQKGSKEEVEPKAVRAKTMEEEGQEIFETVGCSNCHTPDTTPRAPSLYAIYGKKRQMQNGEILTADRNYLRTNILQPNDKVTAGYEATMPVYQGNLTEEQVNSLLAYIKSLGTSEEPKPAGGEVKIKNGKVVKPAQAPKAINSTQGGN
ncbi:MAG: cytochrome c oxidase subunit II [Armatimonadetes bacterium]|nr:cytochrome c oxidase subunit II [Armatimonadota bacterium]